MIELRPYQLTAVEQIREQYRQGRRAPLLVSPTGSGKTMIFSYIAHSASQRGRRTMILCHRQEIIRQIETALNQFATPHGLIAANRTPEPWHLTQLASVQTLGRRLETITPPDVIVVDEAHHSPCESYRTVFRKFPDALRLGVTATPARLSGEGLGDVFDSMVMGPSVSSLIADGFLARPVYYAPPSGVDTRQLKILGGDFRRDQSEAMMDRPHITGSAVEHYRKICDGVSAIVFCTSLKHAFNVMQQFQAAGYRAAMIDGTMTDSERAQRTSGLRDGSIQILVSMDLLGEGFDCPGAGAGIMLRPTASVALHLQQIGRILRPAEGKTRAVILDHVGNCLRHGLAEENREWSLDAKRRKRDKVTVISNRQCPQCYCVHAPAPACPQCAHEYPVKPRTTAEVDGELTELTAAKMQQDKRDRRIEVGMAKDRDALMAIAKKRGYAPGWVWYMLKMRKRSGTKNQISEYVTIKHMQGVPEPAKWQGKVSA